MPLEANLRHVGIAVAVGSSIGVALALYRAGRQQPTPSSVGLGAQPAESITPPLAVAVPSAASSHAALSPGADVQPPRRVEDAVPSSDDNISDGDDDAPPHLTPLDDEGEEIEIHDLAKLLGVEVTLPFGWRHVSSDSNFPSAQAQFVYGEEGLTSVCQPFLSIVSEDLGRPLPEATRADDAVTLLRESIHHAAADAEADDLSIAAISIKEDLATATFSLVSASTGAVAAFVHAAVVLFSDGLAVTLQHVTQNPSRALESMHQEQQEPVALRMAASTLRRVPHPWIGSVTATLRNTSCLVQVTLPAPRSIAIERRFDDDAFPPNSTVVCWSDSSAAGGDDEPFDMGLAVCPLPEPPGQEQPLSRTEDFMTAVWDEFGSRGWLPSSSKPSASFQRRTDVAVACAGRMTTAMALRGRSAAAAFVVLPRRLSAANDHCCILAWQYGCPPQDADATAHAFARAEKALASVSHGLLLPTAPGAAKRGTAAAAPTAPSAAPLVPLLVLNALVSGVTLDVSQADSAFPMGWCARRPVMGAGITSISRLLGATSDVEGGGAITSIDVSVEASGASATDVVEEELAAAPVGSLTLFKDGKSAAVRLDTGVVLVMHAFDCKVSPPPTVFRVATSKRGALLQPQQAASMGVGGHRRVVVLRSILLNAPSDEREVTKRARKVTKMLAAFNPQGSS